MGPKYAKFIVVFPFLMAISVFSKQEIVFARTSPQHKLEIGESQNSLRFMHVLIVRIS
jgi:hypothetical protein